MKENNNTMIFICRDGQKTVKEYLQENRGFSSRLIRFIKKEGRILVNGKEAFLNQSAAEDDVLEVRMPVEAVDAEPEDKPLDILYEDLDLLVINKPSNLVTHPTKGHPENNLANRVAHYFLKQGIQAKIRFVNRLDRDTTGVVVIAKSKFAHQHLQNQMQEQRVEKVYLALVEGRMEESEGSVDLPIGRPSEDSIQRSIMEEGKASVTHYQTLYSSEEASFLQLVLETGRTHQIRVHMKAVGHPLLGDTLYHSQGADRFSDLHRQALHGARIEFIQPRSGEKVMVQAPLPTDMLEIVKKLGWPDPVGWETEPVHTADRREDRRKDL